MPWPNMSSKPCSTRCLALEEPHARALYASLADAEVRHRDIFLGLARDAAPQAWRARAAELAAIEANVLAAHTIAARIH